MRNPAWKEFKLSIPIKAEPLLIYKAWATQEGLEKWFLRQARFGNSRNSSRKSNELVEAGDYYEWLWHGYSDEVIEKGDIISVNHTDQIQFTFGGGCVVTVRILERDAEIICELHQDDIPMIDDPPNEFKSAVLKRLDILYDQFEICIGRRA